MTETSSASVKPSSGWQDWANRTTAVLAVLAALSSGRWGASNLQAILEQGKVNDTWAYYQADSIKSHGARQMQELAKAMGKGEPEQRSRDFEQMAKKFEEEAVDKDADKNQRFKDANNYQLRRDKMVERGFWFEISFAALQLGVILSTIASAAKTKGLWLTALIFGLLGLGVFVNGFTRTVQAPHSWYSSVSDDMSYNGAATPKK